MTLLAIDVDGTLSVTPPCLDFAEWEAQILAEHHPAHPEAIARIPALLANHDAAILLTARSERLRRVTRAWLRLRFPLLSGLPLSMRPVACHLPPPESKLKRLSHWRRDSVTIVDDDPAMEAGADLFVRAWG